MDWKRLAIVAALGAAGAALHYLTGAPAVPAAFGGALTFVATIVAGAMQSYMPKGGDS